MELHRTKYIVLLIEPYVFYLVLAASLFPFFATSTFPVADAPAHLYNSNVIREMLFGRNEFLSEYFSFNNMPVPNWSSHAILGLLLTVLSPEAAEKCLLLLIFAGIPMAARYAFSAIEPEKKYLSLLVIPVAYNCFAGIGFYNFSLGLGMILLDLGFFYRYILNDRTKWYHYLFLAMFLCVTFFCHLVPLVITFMLLALAYCWWLIGRRGFQVRKWFTQKTVAVLFSLIPVLVFVFVYSAMMYTGAQKTSAYLSADELLDYMVAGKPFQVFGGAERPASSVLAFFYLGTLGVCLQQIFTRARSYSQLNFFVLIFLVLIVLQYVFFPDSDGTGAYISLRLAIIFFLGITLVAVVSPISHKFFLLIIPCVLAAHFWRLSFYERIHIENNNCAANVIEQADLVEPCSFVVPLNYDDNYQHVSYSNYFGIKKPVISFFNYEASTGYFPLVWRRPGLIFRISDYLISFKGIPQCKAMLKNRPIYYLVLGNIGPRTDADIMKLKENLQRHCILINTSNFASLYKLK